jgi:hypothetical protein
MTNNEYRLLTKQIQNICRKLGLHDSEHIAETSQNVIADMLESGNRSQPLKYAVIDCLRKESGRKGTSCYADRLHLRNPEREVEFLHDDSVATGGVAWGLARCLGREDRVMFLLKYVWGFDVTDIGNLFGLDQSGIAQKLARIQKSLRQRMEKKEQRKTTGCLEEVLSETEKFFECFEDEEMEGFEPW